MDTEQKEPEHTCGGNWNTLAATEAERAHEDNFQSRWGVYPIPQVGLVCVYDNNPYAKYPGLRDEVFEGLRRYVKGLGLTVVGEASFPTNGEDKGYTRTFLLDGDCDLDDEVVARVSKLHKELIEHALDRAARWPGPTSNA